MTSALQLAGSAGPRLRFIIFDLYARRVLARVYLCGVRCARYCFVRDDRQTEDFSGIPRQRETAGAEVLFFAPGPVWTTKGPKGTRKGIRSLPRPNYETHSYIRYISLAEKQAKTPGSRELVLKSLAVPPPPCTWLPVKNSTSYMIEILLGF